MPDHRHNIARRGAAAVDDKIGVVYKLGELTVADTLETSGSVLEYFKKHSSDPIKLQIKIDYNEVDNSDLIITYFLNGIEIDKTKNSITPEYFKKHGYKLHGFTCVNCGYLKRTQDKTETIPTEVKPDTPTPKEPTTKSSTLKWL